MQIAVLAVGEVRLVEICTNIMNVKRKPHSVDLRGTRVLRHFPTDNVDAWCTYSMYLIEGRSPADYHLIIYTVYFHVPSPPSFVESWWYQFSQYPT